MPTTRISEDLSKLIRRGFFNDVPCRNFEVWQAAVQNSVLKFLRRVKDNTVVLSTFSVSSEELTELISTLEDIKRSNLEITLLINRKPKDGI